VSARSLALRAQADALEAQARALRSEADALDEEAASAPAADERVLMTLDQAAKALDVSRRTLFDRIARGMPSVKRGRLRRVSLDVAKAWIDERTGAA